MGGAPRREAASMVRDSVAAGATVAGLALTRPDGIVFGAALPVVLVVRDVSRRFMESALRLTAFSVVHKPLEREDLLIQLRRMLERFHLMPPPGRPQDPSLE